MDVWIRRVIAFVRLGRPLFLAGGFIMHGLGVVMALYAGANVHLPALLWGQVAITATQLMTHYGNEYFDLAADRANRHPTQWTGGSRVLPRGLLPPQAALVTALILVLMALGAGCILAIVVAPGPLALPLVMLALLLAWGYSAPPLKLHSRGLGELDIALIVPGLTPLLGFYLQTGRLDLLPFLAIVPLICLQFAMSLVIGFPDADADAQVGKDSLIVRLGGERAVRLHNLALVAAYASLPLLVVAGLPPLVGVAAGLGLPVALWQIERIARGAWRQPEKWDSLAFWGIGLLFGTAAAEVAAFLWITTFYLPGR
ncbi:MAG: prenyltransferase [Chloroflexi bacterium]|nr:prenyltransferase [Chloroflexota bacterium]